VTIALAFALMLTVPATSAPPPAGPPPVNAGAAPREVYRLHLAVDIPVTLLAGTLPLLRIVAGDRIIDHDCPCDPSGVNALDRGTVGNNSAFAGTLADATVYGTIAVLPLLDLVDLGANRALAQDLVVYVQTLAVNSGLQNLVNFLASRPRPRTYAGDPSFLDSSEGYLSFYAGHVATAFAALSAASFTVQRRYGARTWPWIVTALVGASVAVERVASGHHFPTDVAAAAVAGTTIGVTIPWLHAREPGPPGRGPRVTILPFLPGRGIAIAGSF
jgi:membrane-associated phospholipid phosphatase